MTSAQRRNRLTTHFSERIPIVTRRTSVFNVHGSVHRKNILIYIQQDATLHSLFYLETALHVSGGTITLYQESKQLSLQHLVFITQFPCCVMWLAYVTHSTQHGKLLYMFRVVPSPFIRRANNCLYSIWYLSHSFHAV